MPTKEPDSSSVAQAQGQTDGDAPVTGLGVQQIPLAETHLLLSLYRTVIESSDVASGLRSALEIVCQLTGWDLGLALLTTADGQELSLVSSWHQDDAGLAEFAAVSRGRFVSREVGMAGRVWARCAPEWTANLGAQTSESFPLATLASRAGIKAAFGAPIIHDQKAVGVLMFYAREVREADEHLLQMVGRVATQLGFALRHKQAEEEVRKQQSVLRVRHDALEMAAVERAVQLQIANESLRSEIVERKRIEEELDARVRQQDAVAHVREIALDEATLAATLSQSLASLAEFAAREKTIGTLLQEVCKRVAETLEVEYCKILELQPDGRALSLRAGVGWQSGLVGRATVEAGTRSQAGYTLASSQPVIVEDLRLETRFSGPSLLLDHGVVSGVSVIIPGRSKPFGVLGAHTVTQRTFHHEDVNFLESIAHILSQVIERRQSETAIQRSESWLRHLVATTQDAVVSIDRRGCVVLFNASAERIFSYTAAEIVGRKVNVLMAEPYATEHDEYIARYERTGEPRAIGRIRNVTAKRKDGTEFPIELSVTEIEVDDDVHYAAFIRDISETVELQSRLIENERLAAIGGTAARIGHEIANPLNGIYLTLQLVEQRLTRQPSPDERVARDIAKVKREIGRLNQLVQEFRTLSRKQTYRFRPTDLSRLVDETMDLQRTLCELRGIMILHNATADLTGVLIDVDEDKLKQALLNLLKNGIEAMAHGGTLTIEVARSGDDVHIEVADTGTGIAPGDDVFAPFFTTKKDGSGLGLIVARQIVSAHGGTITYDSRIGEGTTFRISLPLDSPVRSNPPL
jgi:PAS domain S-box-containing protein